MTTISYRSGVMAADTRAYGGQGTRFLTGVKQKIQCVAGDLMGVSSSEPGAGEALIEWWCRGGDPEAFKGKVPETFSMLIVNPNGEAYLLDNSLLPSGPMRAPYYAIGSGMDLAMGAMFMGASAIEAVRAGCGHDPWSALPIHSLTETGRLVITEE